VPVVPVEHAVDGEVVVQGRGVSDVSDEGVHVGCVGGEPSWVEVADYGGGVDEVAVTNRIYLLETL
jgi:hypothetical protein